MPTSAYNLLEWMGDHHLPLELFREEETQAWVLVDTSSGEVRGSGDTPYNALRRGYQIEQVGEGNADPFPRRCRTNIVTDHYGECAFCGAANGEKCLAKYT